MDRKHEVLAQVFGYAAFRGGQEALIDAQLAGRDALGIMPTGGGKSLCYQIPALLSGGITLVVSPLIALMKDQVAALKKAGVPAAYINSSLTPEQIRAVYKNLLAGRYKIVYVAPERLAAEGFLHTAQALDISILAVDEAHCISQWGQDFRPSYLKIVDFLNTLDRRPVVSAFTATATAQVREDIARILALRDPVCVVTGFDRPNLRFEVLTPQKKEPVLLSLVEARAGKSGIIYCSTRKDVEKVCQMLQDHGVAATRYHAGLSDEERRENQDDFVYDRCPVIVATNAFGMGIDKSNVAYVLHYNMPQSMEAYYQEAGRAGRDGTGAECILLYSASDVRTAKYLIEHSGTNDELTEDERRQLVERDLLRLNQMVGYCRTTACLRGYILSYFGEPHAGRCGHCGNCDAAVTERDVTTQAKMILSCVRRIQDHIGYPVGAALLVRTLRGSRDRRILTLGLDTISTYDLMHDTPRAELRELVEQLETDGYLQQTAKCGALTLTDRARDVLFYDEPVRILVRSAPKPKRRAAKAPAPDDALFEALKALRLQIAEHEHIPAYIVFSNATLRDMAAKRPATMEEFLEVSGVGTYKANLYGEAFLSLLNGYQETRKT